MDGGGGFTDRYPCSRNRLIFLPKALGSPMIFKPLTQVNFTWISETLLCKTHNIIVFKNSNINLEYTWVYYDMITNKFCLLSTSLENRLNSNFKLWSLVTHNVLTWQVFTHTNMLQQNRTQVSNTLWTLDFFGLSISCFRTKAHCLEKNLDCLHCWSPWHNEKRGFWWPKGSHLRWTSTAPWNPRPTKGYCSGWSMWFYRLNLRKVLQNSHYLI